MNRLRVLATIFVVAAAALGIWVAGTGMRTGQSGGDNGDTTGSAYDYEIRDVVVQQMGPDGSLQYELSAKQITQQPQNGQITATDLVMHRDPPGTLPGGANRWTLSANRADLPESGAAITLQGKVHAEGLPQNWRDRISVDTEELAYNLETQDLSIRKPVDVRWGGNRFQSNDLYLNIKTGAIKVDSEAHGTLVPR